MNMHQGQKRVDNVVTTAATLLRLHFLNTEGYAIALTICSQASVFLLPFEVCGAFAPLHTCAEAAAKAIDKCNGMTMLIQRLLQ